MSAKFLVARGRMLESGLVENLSIISEVWHQEEGCQALGDLRMNLKTDCCSMGVGRGHLSKLRT